VTLSGGAVEFLGIEDGSSVTLQGGDFRLNGSPIPGTSDIGSIVNLEQPLAVGDILSGVLADGTSFVFANLPNERSLDGNIPTLHTVGIPTIVPRTFVVSIDGNPGGVRTGQSLVADAPLSPIPFAALPGGAVDVVAGGSIGRMQALDATVNVKGGTVGTLVAIGSDVHISGGRVSTIRSYHDSQVRVTGGQVQSPMHLYLGSDAVVAGGTIELLDVFSDSTAQVKGGLVRGVFVGASGMATISGGRVGSVEGIVAQPDATVHLIGKQFLLNDVPVPGLSLGITLEILRRDATLSGILADGSPFSFQLFESSGGHIFPGIHEDATLLVTLVPEPSCWLLLGWLGAAVGLRRYRG
jgi:hypothetical protein